MDVEEDQSRQMAIIGPLLLGIHDALYEAVATYNGDGYSDAVRAQHSDRAAACCIYDHAERALMDRFDGTPGVNFLDRRGLHLLNYRDQALIRVKKVNGLGQHANYQTLQQQDYDDEMPLLDLPEAAVRLYAGYQMDAAGAAIERVMIVRQIGKDVIWTAQVTATEAQAAWVDITPERIPDTGRTDFEAARARRGR
ncbi:hypothetical protein IVB20_07565 [Bradyrhizobium sp. 188]|nr:hypothetical protein [Bradyrhizobium sp. 188]